MEEAQEPKTIKPLRVRANAIYSFCLQLVFFLAPLITSPHLSRTLGANGIGGFSYCLSIATLFVTVISFGFTNYAAKKIAVNRDDRNECSAVFWSVFFSRLCLGLIALAVYSALFPLIAGQGYEISTMWIMAGLLANAIFDVTYFFQGLENYKVVATISAALKIAAVVLIFVLVRTGSDLWIYSLLYVCGILGGTILCFCLALHYVEPPKRTKIKLWQTLRESFPFFVPTIAVTMYAYLDKSMLGIMAGAEAVGYYEQAAKLYIIASQMIGALFPVMLARMSRLVAESNNVELQAKAEKVADVHGMIGWPAALGLFASARYLIPGYFGTEFMPSINVEYFLAPLAVLSTISAGLMSIYYIPKGKMWLASGIYFIGAAANLIGNVFAIKYLGERGAALTSLITELIVSGLFVFFSRRDLNLRSLLFRELKPAVAAIIMFAGLTALDALFLRGSDLSYVAKSVVLLFAGFLIYTICLVILRFNLVTEAFSKLYCKLKSKGCTDRHLSIIATSLILSVGLVSLGAASFISYSAPLYIDISNEEDLFAISKNLGASYRITEDITLTRPWTPIGSEEKPFRGLLVGQDHWIHGFTFEKSDLMTGDGRQLYGFFGVNEGLVHGLRIDYKDRALTKNDDLPSGIYGAFAGINKGYITSCQWFSQKVGVELFGSGITVGAFAGINVGQIKNCFTRSGFTITECNGPFAIGGFAGRASENAIFDLCRSNATIDVQSATSNSTLQLGGVVGACQKALFSNVYANGSIKISITPEKGSYVSEGGFIGVLEEKGEATMQSCVSNVFFYRIDGDAIGGIIGSAYTNASAKFSSCVSECSYYSTNIPYGGAVVSNEISSTVDRLYYCTEPETQAVYRMGERIEPSALDIYKIGLDEAYWMISDNKVIGRNSYD